MTPTVEAPTLADPVSQAPRSAGERALDHFLAAGFERTEPPILHPAAIFLDMSGEEVRRRLFLTADASGEELCLRPEYTIPVCRAYLASRQGRRHRRIFLSRPGVPRPRGPGRRADADRARKLRPQGRRGGRRRNLRARLEAATAAGGGALAARLGDAGLFDGVLDSLEIARRLAPAPAPRRRARARPRRHLQPAEPGRARRKLACWRRWKAPTTPAPRRWSRTSWRSPASRRSAGAAPARSPTGFSNRPRCGRASRSKPRSARCWKRSSPFPAIPTQAAIELRRLAQSARLDLGAALDAFEMRNGFIAARGVRDRGYPLQRRLRARLRLLHRLRVRGARSRCSGREDRARRRTLRRARAAARRGRGHSRRRRRDHARPARERGER